MADTVLYGRCMNPKCSFLDRFGFGCLHGEVYANSTDRNCINCGCPVGAHKTAGSKDGGSDEIEGIGTDRLEVCCFSSFV